MFAPTVGDRRCYRTMLEWIACSGLPTILRAVEGVDIRRKLAGDFYTGWMHYYLMHYAGYMNKWCSIGWFAEEVMESAHQRAKAVVKSCGLMGRQFRGQGQTQLAAVTALQYLLLDAWVLWKRKLLPNGRRPGVRQRHRQHLPRSSHPPGIGQPLRVHRAGVPKAPLSPCHVTGGKKRVRISCDTPVVVPASFTPAARESRTPLAPCLKRRRGKSPALTSPPPLESSTPGSGRVLRARPSPSTPGPASSKASSDSSRSSDEEEMCNYSE